MGGNDQSLPMINKNQHILVKYKGIYYTIGDPRDDISTKDVPNTKQKC